MRKITKWSIFWITVVLIIYDIVAFLVGENATISVVITDWSYYTPWVPFLFGGLMGHWFFAPVRSSKD